MKPYVLALAILILAFAARAGDGKEGLILDLNADHGVALEAGDRVAAWTNQIDGASAEVFVKRDKGRAEAGSGRPTLRREVEKIGGHSTLVFHRQELINHSEDAFDHLTTGAGYTWLAVIAVYPQVTGLEDVNCFFGNLRNSGNFEGFWAGLNDDNSVWAGTRNGITFGRWDQNNPKIQGPQLAKNRYYVVAGRMGAGTGEVEVELFVNDSTPVASDSVPVNPDGDASKMAVGQERDATNHPGRESFDGELARFLVYERPLGDSELDSVIARLKLAYSVDPGS